MGEIISLMEILIYLFNENLKSPASGEPSQDLKEGLHNKEIGTRNLFWRQTTGALKFQPLRHPAQGSIKDIMNS